MPKPIAFLSFLIIEIALLPISLIGALWYSVSLLLASRRTGMSVVAFAALR